MNRFALQTGQLPSLAGWALPTMPANGGYSLVGGAHSTWEMPQELSSYRGELGDDR